MDNGESSSQSQSSEKSGGSKTIFIILAIVLILLLGAGFYLFKNKNETKQPSAQTITQPVLSPTPDNSFSTIQEALSKSLSLQCDYTDDTGNKMTTYIKNGAIRSDITAATAKGSGSMIMKDKKLYYWNGKTGTVMEFDINTLTASITPAAKAGSTSSQNPQDVVGSMEKFKQFCKPASVDDALFTVPTDVKFTDLTVVMKQGTQITPVSNVTGVMTQEQIDSLKKTVGQ